MPVRGTRLARLLKVIALLRGPSSWNARKLSDHFGTSRRNIHRDLLVLKMAGVPVFRDQEYGEGGSYRINREWFFPTVGLTDQECLDLSLLTKAAETENIPLLGGMCEVRDKLIGTLPAKQQDLIREAHELFEVLSLGIGDHSRCAKIMVGFQKALLTHTQVEGMYRSPHEKKNKRVQLHPIRVFLARQSWYVAARDDADRKVKLYRLTRFQSLKVVERPSVPPTNWSLKEMLGNAWGVMKGQRDYFVEVWFDAHAGELVSEVRWHQTQELEFRKDGSLIFRATVAGLEEIKWWVLGWGPHAVVKKPKELAEEIRELAQATVRNYAGGKGSVT